MSFELRIFGDPNSEIQLIQMVDDHDLELMEQEISYIRELSGQQDFCLKAVRTDNWYRDLSPWTAPAVFGDRAFGDGAAQTLNYLLHEGIVDSTAAKGTYIGGYSLAGLFALWAGTQTDCFDGIAAASPSVWFPGFVDYMRSAEFHTETVYLSLGDREERTRNALMSKVGENIRTAYEILRGEGVDCVLEWNHGNHFRDPDLRTAKAFAWVMRDR